MNNNEPKKESDIVENVNDVKSNQSPRNKKRSIISSFLIVIGIVLILVPLIITRLNGQRNDDVIEEFLKQAENAASQAQEISEEEVIGVETEINQSTNTHTNTDTDTSTDSVSNQQEGTTIDLAEGENVGVESSNSGNNSAVTNKKPLMSKEEIKKRMTGVIIIDKIDVKMVTMDGVDEETLRVAAGRLPGTDKYDEIGNCVLAGHRSYTFGKYFNRLDELTEGDEIIIKTLDKTLKYKVYKKFIVEPDDFSITEKNGTDKILTLFTCHPVAISTHRLVVQAKQVE